MVTNKEQLLEIINAFGINHQKKKFAEESFEFIEAVTNWENEVRTNDYDVRAVACAQDAVTEELADCMVILRQFICYLQIPEEEIERMIEYKTNRTLNRLKNGADKEI
jgi:NTP pyrophosphatase (non-canonical NTP hydrolase)